MEHNAIVEELIVLLQKSLDNAPQLSAGTALIADLGLESIQVIEFLCEVEDRFDLVINEEAISDVQTIADLARVVDKLNGD